MALSLRSTASAFASSASPSITIPAGTLGGDGLYIVTAGGWTPPATAPTGWTVVSAPQGGFWQWAVYQKTAAGTYGAASSDASTSVTLSYTGGTFDVQTAIYVVAGATVTPTITSLFSNASTAGTLNLTAVTGDLMLYFGSARPNASATITLSSGTTDTTRSSDTNSGQVTGHDSPAAGALSQTFTPSTAGSGSTGRVYVALQLNEIFNDTFASAGALTSTTSISGISTTGWGTEGGEPGGLSHTGWATFTPSVTDQYVFSTVGSDHDTVINVYTGTILGSLTLVGTDDNSGGSGTSRLQISLTASTQYYIQVGAQPAGSGGVLSFSVQQSSDARVALDYAEAIVVSSGVESRTALAYTEALTIMSSSTTEARTALTYAEAMATNATTTESRMALLYFEVLTPTRPGFIGWGLPI